jgi:hypothetical protein
MKNTLVYKTLEAALHQPKKKKKRNEKLVKTGKMRMKNVHFSGLELVGYV